MHDVTVTHALLSTHALSACQAYSVSFAYPVSRIIGQCCVVGIGPLCVTRQGLFSAVGEFCATCRRRIENRYSPQCVHHRVAGSFQSHTNNKKKIIIFGLF
jgi:hypothetical protein